MSVPLGTCTSLRGPGSQLIHSTSHISFITALRLLFQFRGAVASVNIGLSCHFLSTFLPPSDPIDQHTLICRKNENIGRVSRKENEDIHADSRCTRHLARVMSGGGLFNIHGLVVNLKLNEKANLITRISPRKERRGGKWITYRDFRG